jgi:cytidine deaminase
VILKKCNIFFDGETSMKRLIACAATAAVSLSVNASEMDQTMKENLMQKALDARTAAYAPYSHYHVGAALLLKNGEVYLGCNIENASYGLTICSERTAVFKAISEKRSDFVAIAVATKDGGAPCGACRQVLNEFNPQMLVLIGNEAGEIVREMPLSALLPAAFGPANLK